MCGIAGFMTSHPKMDKAPLLQALLQSLQHRGPDGHGQYTSPHVALAQTRLAIIDVAGGWQPLYERSPDKGCVLVANGEIYNDLELRDNELKDVSFLTHSDCETPLHLYRKYGLDFVKKLRGMYAIALYDPDKDWLILSRDPFGIKPLYYTHQKDFFLFSSELQTLLKTDLVDRQILPRKVHEFFQLQFTCGSQTMFKNIFRVQPGETIVLHKNKIIQRFVTPAVPEHKGFLKSEAKALAEFEEVMRDSVLLHLRSEVPWGIFLSGGIDSSLILKFCELVGHKPEFAFTACFPQTAVHDESNHAAQMAKALQIPHQTITLTENDFLEILPQVAKFMDDPVADPAIIPTFRLAELASKSVKVILSGEGGDELFGGYGRYRTAMLPWPLGRKMRRKGAFSKFESLFREPPDDWRQELEQTEKEYARQKHLSKLQRAQGIDMAHWLPNDLLTKIDRCLMAHGVEGRVPFLDPVVAAFAFHLSDSLKVHNNLGKWVPRLWLEKHFPMSHPMSKKKGFVVPVGEWIVKHKDMFAEKVCANKGIQEYFHEARLKDFFLKSTAADGQALWELVFFAEWMEQI